MRWPRGIAAIILAAIGMAPGTAAAQDALPTPVDYVAVQQYIMALPAETLIRVAWAGTGQADRAVAIARRESGLRCDAANPTSSARGLFQVLSLHRARAERLGLEWSDIAGPSCYADVVLAFDLWSEQGWRPWS